MNKAKTKIITDFATWTAFSAARRSPIRSQEDLTKLINKPDYEKILRNKKVNSSSFTRWHRTSVKKIKQAAGTGFSYGWAAKLINVYLKSRVYLGGENRLCLISYLHPPIDQYLIAGLKEEVRKMGGEEHHLDTLKKYKSIVKIDKKFYENLIAVFREISKEKNCKLIELEQFWKWN